jgi:hypothetical protein
MASAEPSEPTGEGFRVQSNLQFSCAWIRWSRKAPSLRLAKNESGQDIEISAALTNLVPKRGLEPLQAYTY